MVDYELKDPNTRDILGIERGHLTAGPRYDDRTVFAILAHKNVRSARYPDCINRRKRRAASVNCPNDRMPLAFVVLGGGGGGIVWRHVKGKGDVRSLRS